MKLETLAKDEVEPRNYVDLVKYIENTLGWTWPWEVTDPPWKVRAVEAGKLKKAAAKTKVRGLKKVTVADLKRTVDWMRAERITVKTPMAVTYYIEKALKAQTDELTITDIDEAIARTLVEVEKDPGLTDAERKSWLGRLRRVRDSAAVEAVDEWRQRCQQT